MEQRVSFVLEVQKQEENFARLCRAFGVSRRIGYKWWGRFRESGLRGVEKRGSRPHRSPRRSEQKWRDRVIELRKRYGWWGAKKLRAKLIAQYGVRGVPAASTLGTMLSQAGLVRRRRGRKSAPQLERAPLSKAQQSNEIWAADFKGWFRTADTKRCDPLTVSDLRSRYLLCCEALSAQSFEQVRRVFEKLFYQYGLPRRIRVDNGAPFGSRGPGGFSRLSVWWMRLGIAVEFIAPGHPEQNGVHERMHRTLKAEAVHPPASSLRKQQKRFDEWRRHFNLERPHEALGQQTPAQHYEVSPRLYQPKAQGNVLYSSDYCVRRVRSNGEIKWRGRKRFLGQAFVGELVGLKASGNGHHEIYFMKQLLGELHEADICGLRSTTYVRKYPPNEQQKVLPRSPV